MAVNKNFVVKNGLEVDTNTLFVDPANNRVAIGTTVPTESLDVRGKIKSDSAVDSWVGNFIGIVTAGAVGVTTMTTTDATVSGFSTLGYANATSLNVTSGFSTVQAFSSKDLTVSIGATISKDLQVSGASTVGGASTFTGQSKFAEWVRFEKDISVGGAATVGGALTVTGNATFAGNVDITGDLTYDELNARNINVSGISTIGFLTASNAYLAGVTTFSAPFNVGMGGTMLNVTGTGNSARVGISSLSPAYVLDVIGDINSDRSVKVAGVDILSSASGDATALAIALG
tara:strand:+ start:2588 stop:3451 length:864 start_codon:yes stop_codon:yes gene_type:complete